MNNLPPRLCGLLLVLATLAACSGNLRDVIDEPPQAGLDGLQRSGGEVVVELALRNVNDETLRLRAASLSLTLDGQALAGGRREVPLAISARGREVVRLALPGRPPGLERLEALSSKQVERLPWRMEVSLELDGGGDYTTETNGWLHRVPGQPNRYR